MKKLILLSTLSALLLNCNKKSEAPVAEPAAADTTTATEKVTDTLGPKSFCYMGVTGKDTVFVNIDDNLGTITGKMVNKNNEKDSNKGDLTGFKSGDTLKLTYTFESEGRTGNKNDLYFLQTKDGLTEGIGERDAETGTKYTDEKKNKVYRRKNSQNSRLQQCRRCSEIIKGICVYFIKNATLSRLHFFYSSFLIISIKSSTGSSPVFQEVMRRMAEKRSSIFFQT